MQTFRHLATRVEAQQYLRRQEQTWPDGLEFTGKTVYDHVTGESLPCVDGDWVVFNRPDRPVERDGAGGFVIQAPGRVTVVPAGAFFRRFAAVEVPESGNFSLPETLKRAEATLSAGPIVLRVDGGGVKDQEIQLEHACVVNRQDLMTLVQAVRDYEGRGEDRRQAPTGRD